tara:strand:- start:4028 stop:5080 length:1053 start_codon:yes stop_codon:yes gene_type:complete
MFTKILYQDLDNVFNNKIINWKKIHKKKILITGANGFIASYLISFLIFLNIKKKFNIKIFLITRNSKEIKKKFINNKTRNFVKILNINLNENLDISQKVDYIFHLASNSSPKNYKKFPLNTLEPNVLGTFNLLSYASKIKIKSFIFFSSGEVYGNSKNNILKEEKLFDFNPLTLRASYVEGKKIAETICYSFFKQKKIPIKILRIFHTYGPFMNLNDGRVMMDFVKNAVNEKNIVIKSEGNQKRSFCYISDLIQGLFIVLLKGKNGEAYNLANNNEYYSIKRLAYVISKLTKHKKIIYKTRPKKDNYLISPFNRVYPSIEKIKKLGFKPSIGIKEGFKKTIDFYKNLKID